jgi:hypothetical protein
MKIGSYISRSNLLDPVGGDVLPGSLLQYVDTTDEWYKFHCQYLYIYLVGYGYSDPNEAFDQGLPYGDWVVRCDPEDNDFDVFQLDSPVNDPHRWRVLCIPEDV